MILNVNMIANIEDSSDLVAEPHDLRNLFDVHQEYLLKYQYKYIYPYLGTYCVHNRIVINVGNTRRT